MTNTAHANCTHPATKAARAACRREIAKIVASTDADAADYKVMREQESRSQARANRIPITKFDSFDLFPQPEDDWADNDQFFGSGDDSGPGDADVLDR